MTVDERAGLAALRSESVGQAMLVVLGTLAPGELDPVLLDD